MERKVPKLFYVNSKGMCILNTLLHFIVCSTSQMKCETFGGLLLAIHSWFELTHKVICIFLLAKSNFSIFFVQNLSQVKTS